MFHASFTALYDACVLYPAPLRDLLIELASYDLFKARWSEKINEEWTRHIIAKKTATNPDFESARIYRARDAMNRAIDDCMIYEHEELIDSLSLPDPDDRHVLAAAIKGRADVIVTFNLKDFPEETLNLYGVEAQHPDEFLEHLIDLHPELICLAARKIRGRLRKPPYSVDDYLMSLAKQKLPKTVSFLASRKEFI